MGLSVIFSTKKINEDFVKLIKSTCGVHNVEVLPYENPGKYSLNEVYNMGLKKCTNDIVVFCHDDIKFETKNWGRKILKHFTRNESFGIVGVAGTRYLSTTGRWWDDFSKMHGAVYHEHDGKKWLSRYSKDIGVKLTDVVLVDGLFFGISKSRIVNSFDESVVGFHFYDVEFCFSNYLLGVKIGVCTDIRITHLSVGTTNDEWEKNRSLFVEKYKDSLPVKIKRTFTSNEKFDVLFVSETLDDKSMDLLRNLKDSGHTISVCSQSPQNLTNALNKTKIPNYNLNSPPGFQLGDGKWVVGTPAGPMPSEKGKMYKLKEVEFDLIHTTENRLSEFVKSLYPKTPQFNSDDDEGLDGDILKEYKNVLEW